MDTSARDPTQWAGSKALRKENAGQASVDTLGGDREAAVGQSPEPAGRAAPQKKARKQAKANFAKADPQHLEVGLLLLAFSFFLRSIYFSTNIFFCFVFKIN